MKAPRWAEELPLAEPPTDRWQISLRPLTITIQEGPDGPWQPSILLVVESGTGAVLGHRLLEPTAEPDLVLELLMESMGSPGTGSPRRPQRLLTDTENLLPVLREFGETFSITVEIAPDLPELSYVIHSFEEFVGEKPELYLESEGADPALIENYFIAAAAFYRAAPWKRISDSEPLTMMMDEWESPRYAVVMGKGGITRGLALYDDAEDLEDLYMYGDEDEAIDPSEMSCTAVVYVERNELTDEQRDEIKENGWEVVSYKAVPLATRTDALGPPRLPTMEQLSHIQSALTVVPRFVAMLPSRWQSRSPMEPAQWVIPVNGEMKSVWVGYGLFTEGDLNGDEELEDEETAAASS